MSNDKNKSGLTKARVLCDFDLNGTRRKCDEVVELDESDLHLHRKSVDDHPDSVAYAEKLQRTLLARQRLERDAFE